MATIKDIAQLAGVSHGTASNVLNKRGNVSAEKIQAVEKAAKKLRYEINSQAKQLRAGHSTKVCVILPRIDSRRYSDFFAGLEYSLRQHDFDIELLCTNDIERNEENAIKKTMSQNTAAVVLVSSFVKMEDVPFYDKRFYFIERKPKNITDDVSFASFNFSLAGTAIAKKCIDSKVKSAAFLAGTPKFSNVKNFISAAVYKFDEQNISYAVFQGNGNMRLNDAFEILNSKQEFDAVIALSDEDAENFKEACRHVSLKKYPELLSLKSKSIYNDLAEQSYMLNYKLLGKFVAHDIIKKNEIDTNDSNLKTKQIILDADGFSTICTPVKKNRQLIFLTMQNSTSKAIRMLLPRFQRESGISVNMIEISYEELYKMASECKENSPYDLLRIDMAWMAEMGENIFSPLDDQNDCVKNIKDKIFPNLSDDYTTVGNSVLAFPFDICVQMLFYRKDLFENALIKRKYFEIYKKHLDIPNSFSQFNEIAGFFTKKQNPNSQTSYGTTASFGSTALASCDFLPRFRELGGSIFDREGNLNILTEEMKAAVTNYIQTIKSASNDINQWWSESTLQFLKGDVAMHIVFSSYASEILYSTESKVIGNVGFASIPGRQPLSGGGSIGILKHSSKYNECLEFLSWLYRTDTAEKITQMGGYIANKNLTRNIDLLSFCPWMEDMEKTFETGWRHYRHEKNTRFNEFQFEDILGKAIRSISLGVETAESALLRAQQECAQKFAI